MKIYLYTIAMLALLPALSHAQDFALTERQRTEHLSLKKGLALQGYDPVSYFLEGPKEGSKAITATVKGVTYRFSNEANKETFLADSAKYEPAYGGWCAWAMLDGDKTKVDPETYKIVDGRNFVFYNGFFGNTLKSWNEKDR